MSSEIESRMRDVEAFESRIRRLEEEVRRLTAELNAEKQNVKSLDNTLARVRHYVERKFGVTV